MTQIARRISKDVGRQIAVPLGALLNQFDSLAPSGLILVIDSGTEITASFTINSTNADGHKIYISTNGIDYTLKETVLGATATKQLTGLTSNTLYYIKVTAYKGGSESAACTALNSYTYAIKDEFTTDDDAPITAPRTAEPTGTLAVTDTENKFSISDGKLNFDKKTVAAWGNPGIWSNDVITRAAGIAMLTAITSADYSKNIYLGFDDAKTLACDRNSFLLSATIQPTVNGDQRIVSAGLVNDATYNLCVILRASGAYYLVKGGIYTYWTLLWAETVNNTANLYAAITNNSMIGTADYLKVRNLGGIWADDSLITYSNASVSAGTVFNGMSNGLLELTWQAITNETLDIRFHYNSDDDCYLIKCDQATGTIKLYRYINGTSTELSAGKTQTWTNGTSYRIRIRYYGTNIMTWVDSTQKHITTAATGNHLTFGFVKVSHDVTSVKIYPVLVGSGDEPVNTLYTDISAIQPNAAPNQYSWHDFSDASTMFTDTAKTANVVDDADPIKKVVSKFALSDDLTAPSDGVRPLYKLNILNSLSAGLWNGSDSELTHLVFPQTDFTLFYVFKNNDALKGSHIAGMTDGGGQYLVVTGSSYTDQPSGVIHTSLVAHQQNLVNWNDGWNVIELIKSGNDYNIAINGVEKGIVSAVNSLFPVDSVGRSAASLGADWWMDGYLGERIRYSAALTAETRAKIRLGLATKWAIPNVVYWPYKPV